MENYENHVFTSGRYKGRNLKEVLLLDPVFLAHYYNRALLDRNQRKHNGFILAMEDLMDELKSIDTSQTCPICKEKKVKMFLVPESNGLEKKLVCCSSKNCQTILLESTPGKLADISRFFMLLGCLRGREKKVLTQIFKTAYPAGHLREVLC
ncbi:MAG: hypothetical protein ACOX0H_01080 [Patescibacteria group bacterium]|jgi:hypothetical protein|nr:hypothetical protein [bacterium]HQC49547.1 hypothetical protein [bacterium]